MPSGDLLSLAGLPSRADFCLCWAVPCGNELLQAAVARPDLVISLNLLRKELEERLSAGRAEVAGQAQAAQHQIEQVWAVQPQAATVSCIYDTDLGWLDQVCMRCVFDTC